MTYDGKVFRPEEPVELKPDTRVRVTVETIESIPDKPTSFIQTARNLRLDGPTDWSDRLDEEIYGDSQSAGK